MKRHPRLITALAVAALILVFVVPSALANPHFPDGGNCGHGVCKTTSTITVTYPPPTTTTTTVIKNCPSKGTETPHPPPCGHPKNNSANLGSASGVSVGLVLVVLGSLFLGYLWVQRRRTVKLED